MFKSQLRLCHRNRKLLISRAPTKAKSQEPVTVVVSKIFNKTNILFYSILYSRPTLSVGYRRVEG